MTEASELAREREFIWNCSIARVQPGGVAGFVAGRHRLRITIRISGFADIWLEAFGANQLSRVR